MQASPEPRGRRGPKADWPTPDAARTPGREPREPRRRGVRERWGTYSAGLGLLILGGTALAGAILTILERSDPGGLLGVFLVLGTVLSGLAVRARSAYLLIPAPILCWVVTATLAGAINDRAADTSKVGLLLHGGTWIASGFFAMCIATIVVIMITGIRLFLDFRARPRRPRGAVARDQQPQQQRQTGPRATNGATGPRRPPPGTGPYAPSPGPGAAPRLGGPGPGTGPRASGPYPGMGQGSQGGQYPPPRGDRYNFSSGA